MLFLLAFSFTTVQHWITTRGFTGGVIVVFLLLFTCGLGLPLPEDIPLIIAGAFLCSDAKSWAIAGAAAWLGIMGGDIMLYSLGKKFGEEITRVPFVGKHVTRERIARVEELFSQYGAGVVAVGRLFAGIRGAMVVAAGATRYNFVKFIIADGLAAIFSGGLFMLLGHWLGAQLLDPAMQKRIHEFKEVFALGGILVAILIVCWFIWGKRHQAQIINAEVKVVEKVEQAKEKVLQKVDAARNKPAEGDTQAVAPPPAPVEGERRV